MNNKVFIIAGPSGVGKNYIISKVLAEFDNCVGIPTYTTRPARIDDKTSKSRICIGEKEFLKMQNNREFFEHKEFNGNFYGKKRLDFENAFINKNNLILEVDTQGLSDYKKEFGDDLISIFICYENLKALRQRIKSNRPDASEEDIKARSEIAIKEMKMKNKYDYVVTNIENHPEIAVDKVIDIIKDNL